LTLSQEFALAGAPGASHFQTAGTLFLAARDWVFLLGSGLVFSLSALILNYLLYQSKLIPRWLSGWGLVGVALGLAAYLNQFFSASASASSGIELGHIPIFLQEMVLAVWLIVKGFNSSAIASESTKQI
jgi:hypothetical protein